MSGNLLVLPLFEQVVAGFGEDEAASQSWLGVEPFRLFPSARLTGQSKVSSGADPLQGRVCLATS